MTTPSLEKFVEIIEKSGLPQSRVDYWLGLIEQEKFGDAEFEQLDAEMKAHYAELDLAVRVKEAQIADQQQEKAEIEEKLLPIVEDYAKAQPEILAEEKSEMENEYKQTYEEMLGELQTVKVSQEKQDIDAIHKFLATSKPANDNASTQDEDEGVDDDGSDELAA